MNLENLRQVSWIGDRLINKKIKAVLIEFHGLGCFSKLKEGYSFEEKEFAKQGILKLIPYCGPWSWMNRVTREFVDEVLEAVYNGFSLEDKIPLILIGGSMGGLGALLYSRYSKRCVTACMALYPVCDLKYHFFERSGLPATMFAAFRGYKEDWEEILEEHSPINQIDHMPDIPYLVLHGEKDISVNKKFHSDRLVCEMRKKNFDIEYLEISGYGHGGVLPKEAADKLTFFLYSKFTL